MPRLRYGLLLTLLCLPLVSCDDHVADAGPVEIRVHNGSTATMADVLVHFPLESVDYGTLAPGEVSGYRAVELAYRIASVGVIIDGESRALQVVDYVGEEPLMGGRRYTYRLDLLDGVSLTQELQAD